MSMNVYIEAVRKIAYRNKAGKRKTDIQRIKFNAVQTPSEVTYEILESAAPAETYREYIRSRSCIEREPIYAKDDIMCEYEPIGYQDYDWTVDHLSRFDEWVKAAEEEGYTIEISMI